MTLIPARLVDALPEKLWWLGNTYRVFGHRLHLCIGDACRTIEFDGREVGRGRKPLDGFHPTLSDDALDRLWRLDFGWIALLSLIIAATPSWALRLVGPDRSSGDIGAR
jgi:hypothetical protein